MNTTKDVCRTVDVTYMMETDGLGRPLASIVVLASRGVGTVSLLVLVLVLLAPLENGWPVEFAPPSGLQRPKLIWHPTSQCSLVLPHHPCSEQQSPYSEPWQVRITAVPQVPSCETSTTCADARAASPRRRTAGAHRHSHLSLCIVDGGRRGTTHRGCQQCKQGVST